MAKNLEKQLPKSEDAIELPAKSQIELDDGILELDDELELDDDGNFISSDLDDEAEPETEEPEDGEDAEGGQAARAGLETARRGRLRRSRRAP